MRKLLLFGVVDFLFGVFLSHIVGEHNLIQVDYFKQFKLELYAKQEVEYSVLLWKIIWDRAKFFSFIILFSMTRFREYLLYIVAGMFILLLGFMNGAYCICFGFKGIIIVLGILLPHFVIYGFAIYLIGSKKELCKVRNGYYYKMRISYVMVTFGLFLLGCLMETFVGTRFFKMILKWTIK